MLETRVEQALAVLGSQSVGAWLREAGIEIVSSDQPAHFGTAVVRGYYEADHRRITVCTRGLDAAFPARWVLAHEAFHAIDPGCPSALAEAAADEFARRTCS